jgi:hypothetical protein
MNSCWLRRMTCEEAIEQYSNMEFELIVHEIKWNGNDLRLYGVDPKMPTTESNFFHIGAWSYDLGDKFVIGDTLIKKKGEPIIRAYRKKERWCFTFKCENEIVSSENVRF